MKLILLFSNFVGSLFLKNPFFHITFIFHENYLMIHMIQTLFSSIIKTYHLHIIIGFFINMQVQGHHPHHKT